MSAITQSWSSRQKRTRHTKKKISQIEKTQRRERQRETHTERERERERETETQRETETETEGSTPSFLMNGIFFSCSVNKNEQRRQNQTTVSHKIKSASIQYKLESMKLKSITNK